MAQRKTPGWLRRGLPADPDLRRKEYLRRYGRWWRKQHPAYMPAYRRHYANLG